MLAETIIEGVKDTVYNLLPDYILANAIFYPIKIFVRRTVSKYDIDISKRVVNNYFIALPLPFDAAYLFLSLNAKRIKDYRMRIKKYSVEDLR